MKVDHKCFQPPSPSLFSRWHRQLFAAGGCRVHAAEPGYKQTEIGRHLEWSGAGRSLPVSSILSKLLIPLTLSRANWLGTLLTETDGLTKHLCYPVFNMFLEDLPLDMTTKIATVLPLPDFSSYKTLVPSGMQLFLFSEHVGLCCCWHYQFLKIYLSTHLSTSLWMYLSSICLSVCIYLSSIYLFIYVSMYLSSM